MKRVLMLITIVTAVLAMLCGCAENYIHEDLPLESLPQIDPNDGAERYVETTLYYMLENEELLIPIKSSLAVKSNERTEYAMVAALISGSSNIYAENCFHPDTRIVDVTESGSVFYVTLSSEFLEIGNYVTTDLNLKKRMRVYSIVNSICGINRFARVQILVDIEDTGKGERLTLQQLGFSGGSLIEPMSFQEDILISPKTVTLSFFDHLSKKEYTFAYNLLSDVEMGGKQKPSYDIFMELISHIDAFSDASVISVTTNKSELTADVEAIITLINRLGVKRTDTETLSLIAQRGVFKLNYSSFEDAFAPGEKND